MFFLHFGFYVTIAIVKCNDNQVVTLLVRFLLLVDELVNNFFGSRSKCIKSLY